ncbi:hypothetical protein BMS3Abin16_00639 [archaeon BMS3Abin16]|nr:hypothetical protein BMS3Abin16_00639 [archaeon BMS3Abin16]
MKEILLELRESMSGVVGSFVLDEEGEIISQDMPELLEGPASKVSKSLHHVTNVIRATRSVDKLTVDSENAKFISLPAGDKVLVVVAEKTINQPLFQLMSNMAGEKLKKAKTPAPAPRKDEASWDEIITFYDQLFGEAAKRLANIIGPKSATHFYEGSEAVRNSHPLLFANLGFGPNGKPDVTAIRKNAENLGSTEELTKGVEEMLESMLETVEQVAGKKQRERALEEIDRIRENKGKTQ